MRTCHLGQPLTTPLLALCKTLTWNNVIREDNFFNGSFVTLIDDLLVARSALYRITMLELFRSIGAWVSI